MTNLSVSVTLTPELRLVQALKDAGIENPASVAKLTVAGTMTDDDFSFITEHMAETLQKLNMKNATLEENRIQMYYSKVLTSVILPASLVAIGERAFSGCPGLTSITIPDGVTSINCCAFSGCRELTSITIPASVTCIEWCAFLNCASLTWIDVNCDNACYASVDGVLFNKNKTTLVQFPAGKPETAYSIPNGVISIESGAFDCCRLTSVTIPDGAASIGYGVFDGCYTLTSITCLCPSPPETVGFLPYLLSRCRLYVPQKWLHLYRNAEHWKGFECVPIKKKDENFRK